MRKGKTGRFAGMFLLSALLFTLPAFAKTTGDVNGDGSVNMQDRTILARYLADWSGYESKVDKDAAAGTGTGLKDNR